MIRHPHVKLSFEISYGEFCTERRIISDMIVQVDIRSAQQVNSPKYLYCAHQTQNRTNVPDKKINIAIFDNLDLRIYFVEIDGQRYPRDSLYIRFEEKNFIEQNKI